MQCWKDLAESDGRSLNSWITRTLNAYPGGVQSAPPVWHVPAPASPRLDPRYRSRDQIDPASIPGVVEAKASELAESVPLLDEDDIDPHVCSGFVQIAGELFPSGDRARFEMQVASRFGVAGLRLVRQVLEATQ